MAKKVANQSSKTMSKKGMKKTKGGILIGLSKPATINFSESPRDPAITGNTLTGNNTINGGTLTNNTFTGGV